MLNHYVEQRFRYIEYDKKYKFSSALILITLLLLLTPHAYKYAIKSQVYYKELLKPNVGLNIKCDYYTDFKPLKDCSTSNTSQVLIWGDSFAMHLVPGILATLDNNIGLIQATKSFCGPLLNIAPITLDPSLPYNSLWAEECINFNQSVIEYLEKTPSIETVVISSPLMQYLDSKKSNILAKNGSSINDRIELATHALKETISAVKTLNRKIVIISPPPSAEFNIGKCLMRHDLNLPSLGNTSKCHVEKQADASVNAAALTVLSKINNSHLSPIIYLSDYLCNDGICKTRIEDTIIYRDSGHLSYSGSVILFRDFELIKKILDAAE